MRAVWSWLKELCELPDGVDAERAATVLTGAGLEVESVESVGGEFSGVVIAEVASKRKHPDADKLTLVDVIDASGFATEVVCGAPNVPEPGGRVLWARPGARLPGGFDIARREIKGVVSAGMLCSESELGLGDDHDGIIVLEPGERGAALGADAASALGLADVVFEVGIPANRPDALGHIGLARELVAHVGGRVVRPKVDLEALTDPSLACADLVAIAIRDPERCRRYIGRVIDGLTVGKSPRWMRRRLEMVGVRPLSNLVDVTNYVMFETGQPLHAFDYRRVRGQRIEVRLAVAGEKMKTLDEVARVLEPDDLLICDGEGPVALAGVMGGLESEVAADTSRVLLEAAHFEPKGVRRTSKRLGLRSESSYRFERHVDPNGTDAASIRAASLLAEIGGGKIAAGVVDVYPRPAEPVTVSMRASRATLVTGVDISAGRARELLAHLGLEVRADADGDTLIAAVPTSRPDLTREIDLIEEVLRLHGFDKVPATLPALSSAPSRTPDLRPRIARELLTGAGLSEAITFAWCSPSALERLGLDSGDPRSAPIAVQNPMTIDGAAMRTSLLPNLLAAVAHNLAHQVADIGLFEIGSVFLGEVKPGTTDLPSEPRRVAAVLAGRGPGHLGDRRPVDVFDLKGVLDNLLEALLASAGARASFRQLTDCPYLHPGHAASILAPSGEVVGEIGEVHPAVRAQFGIEEPVYAFELALDELPEPAFAQMQPIARYPAVTRDVSFFVDAEISAERVRLIVDRLRGGAGEELLESLEILEDYRDPVRVPAGQKGMLWTLTYRAGDRTLTDAEVDAAHETLTGGLLRELSATRR
jgi:phenylalanyl-tRNA synthetase beta chain